MAETTETISTPTPTESAIASISDCDESDVQFTYKRMEVDTGSNIEESSSPASSSLPMESTTAENNDNNNDELESPRALQQLVLAATTDLMESSPRSMELDTPTSQAETPDANANETTTTSPPSPEAPQGHPKPKGILRKPRYKASTPIALDGVTNNERLITLENTVNNTNQSRKNRKKDSDFDFSEIDRLVDDDEDGAMMENPNANSSTLMSILWSLVVLPIVLLSYGGLPYLVLACIVWTLIFVARWFRRFLVEEYSMRRNNGGVGNSRNGAARNKKAELSQLPQLPIPPSLESPFGAKPASSSSNNNNTNTTIPKLLTEISPIAGARSTRVRFEEGIKFPERKLLRQPIPRIQKPSKKNNKKRMAMFAATEENHSDGDTWSLDSLMVLRNYMKDANRGNSSNNNNNNGPTPVSVMAPPPNGPPPNYEEETSKVEELATSTSPSSGDEADDEGGKPFHDAANASSSTLPPLDEDSPENENAVPELLSPRSRRRDSVVFFPQEVVEQEDTAYESRYGYQYQPQQQAIQLDGDDEYDEIDGFNEGLFGTSSSSSPTTVSQLRKKASKYRRRKPRDSLCFSLATKQKTVLPEGPSIPQCPSDELEYLHKTIQENFEKAVVIEHHSYDEATTTAQQDVSGPGSPSSIETVAEAPITIAPTYSTDSSSGSNSLSSVDAVVEAPIAIAPTDSTDSSSGSNSASSVDAIAAEAPVELTESTSRYRYNSLEDIEECDYENDDEEDADVLCMLTPTLKGSWEDEETTESKERPLGVSLHDDETDEEREEQAVARRKEEDAQRVANAEEEGASPLFDRNPDGLQDSVVVSEDEQSSPFKNGTSDETPVGDEEAAAAALLSRNQDALDALSRNEDTIQFIYDKLVDLLDDKADSGSIDVVSQGAQYLDEEEYGDDSSSSHVEELFIHEEAASVGSDGDDDGPHQNAELPQEKSPHDEETVASLPQLLKLEEEYISGSIENVMPLTESIEIGANEGAASVTDEAPIVNDLQVLSPERDAASSSTGVLLQFADLVLTKSEEDAVSMRMHLQEIGDLDTEGALQSIYVDSKDLPLDGKGDAIGNDDGLRFSDFQDATTDDEPGAMNNDKLPELNDLPELPMNEEAVLTLDDVSPYFSTLSFDEESDVVECILSPDVFKMSEEESMFRDREPLVNIQFTNTDSTFDESDTEHSNDRMIKILTSSSDLQIEKGATHEDIECILSPLPLSEVDADVFQDSEVMQRDVTGPTDIDIERVAPLSLESPDSLLNKENFDEVTRTDSFFVDTSTPTKALEDMDSKPSPAFPRSVLSPTNQIPART